MATFSIPAVSLALAQVSQPGDSALAQFVKLLALWGPIIVIIYFFLVVPQQRQRKRVEQLQNALKAGDKVVLTCGIYGTIVGVENDTVQLRVAEQMRIRVSKQSVASLQAEPKES